MEHKLLVNWTDSMGVSPEHLRQTEDYFTELVSNGLIIGTENHKFGLLPPSTGERNPVELIITESVTGHIELTLRKYKAITQGGYLIRFDSELYGEIFKTYDLSTSMASDKWIIILSVNPYKRIPVGVPDEEEDPPRHPDAVSLFDIHALSANEVNTKELGPQQLIVGKVTKHGGKCRVDDYIPPCTHVASHPALVGYYNRFALMVEELEKDSKDIIAKIHGKKNPSALAVNIETMCKAVMDYMALYYFSFRNGGLYWSPFKMAECFSGMAHKLYINLSFISPVDKEELLNYFHEWDEINPGAFDVCITRAMEMQYDHYDIASSMEITGTFLSILSQLWDKLNQLEYIGQHKEGIIISDKKLQEERTNRKRWSFVGG